MERAIGALLASALLLAACSDGNPAAAPTPCPSPVPVDQRDLRLLPRDVPLADYGPVTEVEVEAGFIGAQAITETTIIELYPPLARAVLDEGYDIVSSENEGFEAEIFFAQGTHITGAYRLREGPCKGQVTIKLLYGSKRYRRQT